MSQTLTVASDITAVDTRTQITGQGSVSAPSLVVPSGSKVIARIVAAMSAEGLANGSAVFFVRLGGTGILQGEQTLMVSAAGTIAPQSGSDAAPQYCKPNILDNLNIPVSPGDVIAIAAEMAGSDLGTARAVITVVFA